MNYEKLGEFIHLPKIEGKPLENVEKIKFNYYLASRLNGNKIDVDITTKLFHGDSMYVRKACFRVVPGQMETCLKENLIDHMRSLGMDNHNIPQSLINIGITNHAVKCSTSNSY